jgi:hypothetical protein
MNITTYDAKRFIILLESPTREEINNAINALEDKVNYGDWCACIPLPNDLNGVTVTYRNIRHMERAIRVIHADRSKGSYDAALDEIRQNDGGSVVRIECVVVAGSAA